MINRTFFNSRNQSLYDNYTDINNVLCTIFFKSGAELNLIYRDLKKNKIIENYIYNKVLNTFDNVAEIEISKLSLYEYNILKQYKTPSINKIC